MTKSRHLGEVQPSSFSGRAVILGRSQKYTGAVTKGHVPLRWRGQPEGEWKVLSFRISTLECSTLHSAGSNKREIEGMTPKT